MEADFASEQEPETKRENWSGTVRGTKLEGESGALADGERDGLADAERDGLADGERDGLADGERDGLAEGERDGLADGEWRALGVAVRERLRQTAGSPGNSRASVVQLSVEKLPPVAFCKKLSKWQSQNSMELEDTPCTRNRAELPAIALSETVIAVETKKSPW
jgi:hypothetical protein